MSHLVASRGLFSHVRAGRLRDMWIEKATRGRVIASAVIGGILGLNAIAGFLLFPEWVHLTRTIAFFSVLAMATIWIHVC